MRLAWTYGAGSRPSQLPAAVSSAGVWREVRPLPPATTTPSSRPRPIRPCFSAPQTVVVPNDFFADATSGAGSFRFRFLYPQAPDAEGRTAVDLNRAQLPQCAFADHFLCPFPPPGNTLDVAVEAGERNLR